MNFNKVLDVFAGVFNQKNLDSGLKAFDKGMAEFSKGLNDFGSAMGTVSNEMANDNERYNKNQADREVINKKNLYKIWGDKK